MFVRMCGDLGVNWRTARWKSSLSITPRARARPGFRPTGKFSARTWPDSTVPPVVLAGEAHRASAAKHALLGGQNVR